MAGNDETQTRKSNLADNDNQRNQKNRPGIRHKHRRVDHHADRNEKHRTEKVLNRLNVLFDSLNQTAFRQNGTHDKSAQRRRKAGTGRQINHAETQTDGNQQKHFISQETFDFFQKRRHQINSGNKTQNQKEHQFQRAAEQSLAVNAVAQRNRRQQHQHQDSHNVFNHQHAENQIRKSLFFDVQVVKSLNDNRR